MNRLVRRITPPDRANRWQRLWQRPTFFACTACGYGETVHPIEHLRYLARAGDGATTEQLVSEAAQSLAACAGDPPTLLTSAKTLLRHQPGTGPLWWLCARLLAALDPRSMAWESLDELQSADTAKALAAEIPDGARVCVVGSPTHIPKALRRRGDVSVVVIEVDGSGYYIERDLADADVECESVEAHRLGAVVEYSDLVLVEPPVIGDATALFSPGNVPAIATARLTRTPVWAVCGPGQRLPEPFCQAIVERVMLPAPVPWVAPLESLGLAALDKMVTVDGLISPESPPEPTCPFTPEVI